MNKNTSGSIQSQTASKLKPPSSVKKILNHADKENGPPSTKLTNSKLNINIKDIVPCSKPLQKPKTIAKTILGQSGGQQVKTKPIAKATAKNVNPPVTSSQTCSATSKRPGWDIKGKLQDAEAKVVSLNSQNQALLAQTLQLQQEIETEISKSKMVQDERDGLQSQHSSLVLELSHLKQLLNEKVAVLDVLKREHEDEIQFLMTKSKEQLQQLEMENDQFKVNLSELNIQLTVLQSKNVDLSEQLQNFQRSGRDMKLQFDVLKVEYEDKFEQNKRHKGQLEDANVKILQLNEQLIKEEQQRRYLHNLVQELKGNIRVFCRIRPPLAEENQDLSHINLSLVDEGSVAFMQVCESADGQRTNVKENLFQFDTTFPINCTQSQVFDEVSQLIQSACDGYNVCIFAYGQTGSGKSFTMEGNMNSPDQFGVIPRSAQLIWNHAQKLRDLGWEFEFSGSYLEIYNEQLYDLLRSDYAHSDNSEKLSIKLDSDHEIYVAGQSQVPLLSEKDVLKMITNASKNRRVAETLCNERSSRSHSVFTLNIKARNSGADETLYGSLNLIDLAGSERLAKSGATGDRLKETQAINKSLSALGDVIMALSRGDSHIPYRNSKLTHLLQSKLGGNSKVLMFVNVSPGAENISESINTLRFATKVNNCHIGVAKRQTLQYQ
ncbi:hypothetical protein MIR68_009683 [Amoeboaphelidium protococcarum]|nr:hypothetical protein MIR68_009683 [Amoeboaphelidium protococcarum]